MPRTRPSKAGARPSPPWKAEARKGARFLVILVLVFLVLDLVFSLGPVDQAFKETTAFGSSLVMKSLGVDASPSGDLVVFNGEKARIVSLCTGSLELAVLVAAVVATEDRSVRSRILGIAFSSALLLGINYIRVGVTLASAVWYGWAVADLLHSFLFRLFLVVSVFGIYAVWYLWVCKR